MKRKEEKEWRSQKEKEKEKRCFDLVKKSYKNITKIVIDILNSTNSSNMDERYLNSRAKSQKFNKKYWPS